MIFSSRLPLSALILLCRSLRHYLAAGLTVNEALGHLARKGPAASRALCERVLRFLNAGLDLSAAFKKEQAALPPLMISLVTVGESTGMLAEVFGDLEKHYIRQQQLWRAFIARITWPVVQLVAAIFVIAGLIYFLGVIAEMRGPGQPPYDPLGLGLSGASGALIFLGMVFGLGLILFVVYLFATRGPTGGVALQRWFLGLPMLGPCLQTLALARFCTAMRLTHETGMSVGKGLRLSFEATGNPAWQEQGTRMKAATRSGEDLTTILTQTRLFPEEFLHVLAVAEESGSISEVMERQAEHYHEEAGRSLAALTALAGYAIWLLIAVIIIIAIFRLYGSYLSQLG